MRKPTPTQLDGQLDELVAALKQAKRVVPILADQARLERNELTGNLPEASVVCGKDDCDGRPHGLLSRHGRREDAPTGIRDVGDVVIAFDAEKRRERRRATGDPDPAEDLERIARWYGDLSALVGSTRRLLGQVPAVALAVHDGRRPTDGRSAEEFAQRRYVRALQGEPCLVVTDHEEEDRFGAGQLRRGLCDKHRKAWDRQGRPDIEEFIVSYGPRRPEAAVVVELGAYRTDLKEVA